MPDPCCNSFGGRIAIEVDGVRYPATDADITVRPTNSEVEASANQDGSAAYMVKPVLPSFSATFRNSCGLKWSDAMKKCAINATIVEEDSGRTHLFTGGRFVGRPEISLTSGEVTGLEVHTPTYQAIEAHGRTSG